MITLILRVLGFCIITLAVILGGGNNLFAKDCTDDSQCSEGEYCKGGGEATDVNRCRDCEKECEAAFWFYIPCRGSCWLANSLADCGNPLITIGTCEPRPNMPEKPTVCQKNEECKQGEICYEGLCIKDECQTSADCPIGSVCTRDRNYLSSCVECNCQDNEICVVYADPETRYAQSKLCVPIP